MCGVGVLLVILPYCTVRLLCDSSSSTTTIVSGTVAGIEVLD